MTRFFAPFVCTNNDERLRTVLLFLAVDFLFFFCFSPFSPFRRRLCLVSAGEARKLKRDWKCWFFFIWKLYSFFYITVLSCWLLLCDLYRAKRLNVWFSPRRFFDTSDILNARSRWGSVDTTCMGSLVCALIFVILWASIKINWSINNNSNKIFCVAWIILIRVFYDMGNSELYYSYFDV